MPTANQQNVVRLMRRPIGNIQIETDLVIKNEDIPSTDNIGNDEVLLHRLFLSLDPAMRGWMRDVRSYIPPVQVGDIMRGTTINEVVFSRNDNLKFGDIVMDNSMSGGWSEYAIVRGKACMQVRDLTSQGLSLSSHLGIFGGTGLTAYFGLLDIGSKYQDCNLK